MDSVEAAKSHFIRCADLFESPDPGMSYDASQAFLREAGWTYLIQHDAWVSGDLLKRWFPDANPPSEWARTDLAGLRTWAKNLAQRLNESRVAA